MRAITVEDLYAAIDKLRNQEPWVCGQASHPHVVHPRAVGWSVCGYCGQPVDVRSARRPPETT